MVVSKKDIQSRVNRYRTLSQYKGFTEKQLREVALKNAKKSKKINDRKIGGEYLDAFERKRAQEIFNDYLATNHIENPVELDTLKNLVQIRIFLQRMEGKIKKLNKKDDFSHKGLMNDYLALMNKKKEMEKDLGLFTTKKDDTWLNFWLKYKKKVEKYIQTHKSTFLFKCPSCKQMCLQVKKIDDFDSYNWNFFKGTVLYNKPLMKLLDEKRLTETEVSEVFGLNNNDYVKNIFEKIYMVEKRKNLIDKNTA